MVFLILLNILLQVESSTYPAVTTWNIGLEEKYNDQRTPAIIEALNSDTQYEDADFVCLAEVWGGPKRIKTVINAVKTKYPYYWTLVDNSYITSTSVGIYSPPCSFGVITGDIKNLTTCLNSQTLGCSLSDPSLECILPCLFNVFGNLMTPLTNDCWGCLLEQAYQIYSGGNPLNSLMECETDTSQPWIQTLGLVVLSKYPLTVVNQSYYETFFFPRGWVSVTTSQWNNTLFTCTHLPVIQSLIPYVPDITTKFTSWDEENQAATATLVGNLTSANILQTYPNQLTMGDFNHSPNVPSQGVGAVDLSAYQVINTTYGARNLYVERQGNCTACSDNDIAPEIPSAILDHIWMRGNWWTYNVSQFSTYRIWDQIANISSSSGSGCSLVDMSDHYAVHLIPATPNLNLTKTSIDVCSSYTMTAHFLLIFLGLSIIFFIQ